VEFQSDKLIKGINFQAIQVKYHLFYSKIQNNKFFIPRDAKPPIKLMNFFCQLWKITRKLNISTDLDSPISET